MTGGNGLDTIVFGASKLGIGTIGYLKDRYNILYCIDNDEINGAQKFLVLK